MLHSPQNVMVGSRLFTTGACTHCTFTTSGIVNAFLFATFCFIGRCACLQSLKTSKLLCCLALIACLLSGGLFCSMGILYIRHMVPHVPHVRLLLAPENEREITPLPGTSGLIICPAIIAANQDAVEGKLEHGTPCKAAVPTWTRGSFAVR